MGKRFGYFCAVLSAIIFSLNSYAGLNLKNQKEAIQFLKEFRIDDPSDTNWPKNDQPFLEDHIEKTAAILALIEDPQEFNRVFELFKQIVRYNFDMVYGEQCERYFLFYFCSDVVKLPGLTKTQEIDQLTIAMGIALQADGAEQFIKYQVLLERYKNDLLGKQDADDYTRTRGSYFTSTDRRDHLIAFGLLSITPLFPIGLGGLCFVAGKSGVDALYSSYYGSDLCKVANKIRPIIDEAQRVYQEKVGFACAN